ncbi:MAG: beta-ketoacyl-ACP synthase, partial [Pseudodesulfovibrio sp.]|nr:beta-ketoacyl-ACP synthase [Pseudodesulfovibrio sp.]
MKKAFGTILAAGFICCMTLMVATMAQAAAELEGITLEKKQLVVHRGFTKAAKSCIECHSQKTPGIIENWKNGKMGHATVSCYDCHAVEKDSPMAS